MDFDVNGFRMHYEIFGMGGEPLLWLHGWSGSGEDWKFIFNEAPAGFRVLGPDMRGNGASSGFEGTHTFRQSARDVFALIGLNYEIAPRTLQSRKSKIRPVITRHRARSVIDKFRRPPEKKAAFVLGAFENIPGKQGSLRRPLDNARFQGDEKLVQLLELLA